MSSVAALLYNRSGLLSMLGRAHITKLCKDIGGKVNTVFFFAPNAQRFGTSLKEGHSWKCLQRHQLTRLLAEAICCGEKHLPTPR